MMRICWLKEHELGGASRPGLTAPLRQDLGDMGIDVLVSLTAEWQLDTGVAKDAGIVSHHFPIEDYMAPSIQQATDLCHLLDMYRAQNKAVVLHCHAGKGRTGVMLAASKIWRGMTADASVKYIRAINSRWIETDIQLAFLDEFEATLSQKPPLLYLG